MSSTNFVVEPNYNLKMARSVKKLGKFDLKCAKIGKNGRKINFPYFWGKMSYQEYLIFVVSLFLGFVYLCPPGASSWNIDRWTFTCELDSMTHMTVPNIFSKVGATPSANALPEVPWVYWDLVSIFEAVSSFPAV